jgi:hypothetical protein
MARLRRVFPPGVLKAIARAVAEELTAANPGYEVVPHVEGRELPGAHHLPGALPEDREAIRRRLRGEDGATGKVDAETLGDVRSPLAGEGRGDHD